MRALPRLILIVRSGILAAAITLAAVSVFGQTSSPQALRDVDALLQARRYDEAIRTVSAALSAAPRDAALLNARGVIFANTNQAARARQDFEAAVRLAPAMTEAWQNLARLCQNAPGLERAPACAANAWRNVLRLNTQDPEARFSLAAVYAREKKYQESIQELDLLPAGEISRPGALVLRCANLAALGRTRGAGEAARRAVESREFSRPDVAWLLPRLTSPAEAPLVVTFVEALAARRAAANDDLRRLVPAYETMGRWKDARATLEVLAAAEPRNPDHLYELAHVAYVQHDLEGALGYLGHTRDLVPGEARVHFLFGLILVELNLPPEARKSLEKAVELAPDNADYRYALGSVILRARDPSPAVDCFRRYVEARPGDARGEFALGLAYFLTGNYEESGARMRRVKDNPATRAGALYFLGRIARSDGDLETAAADFEESIRTQPAFAQGYAELARVRLEQRRQADAEKALARALEIDPDNLQANSTLLALYQRTHDPRAEKQSARVKALDEQRGKEQEMMLRGVEVKPY